MNDNIESQDYEPASDGDLQAFQKRLATLKPSPVRRTWAEIAEEADAAASPPVTSASFAPIDRVGMTSLGAAGLIGFAMGACLMWFLSHSAFIDDSPSVSIASQQPTSDFSQSNAPQRVLEGNTPAEERATALQLRTSAMTSPHTEQSMWIDHLLRREPTYTLTSVPLVAGGYLAQSRWQAEQLPSANGPAAVMPADNLLSPASDASSLPPAPPPTSWKLLQELLDGNDNSA